MSMRQLTSRSTMASVSSVPSQDIAVSRSHAADEWSLRGTREDCSRDRRQRLIRIVVAVVAMCAAILVAAAIVRIGRMKSDRAASPLGSAYAFPASTGTIHSNVSASTSASSTLPPVSGAHARSHCAGPFGSRAQALPGASGRTARAYGGDDCRELRRARARGGDPSACAAHRCAAR